MSEMRGDFEPKSLDHRRKIAEAKRRWWAEKKAAA